MEVVHYGVPSIVLPFHTEQESNGRRIEACGAAVVLSPASVKENIQVEHGRWAYGEFSTCVHPDTSLTSAQLRDAIAQVLDDSRYRVAAQSLSAEAARHGGAEAAIDFINGLV